MGRQDLNSIVKTEALENEKNASDKPGLSLKLKISKTGSGFVSDLKDGKDGNIGNPLVGNSMPPNVGNQATTAPKKRAKKNKSNSTESDENPKKVPKKRKTKAEREAEKSQKENAAKNINTGNNNNKPQPGQNLPQIHNTQQPPTKSTTSRAPSIPR